jgi:hypothetical protein
MAASKDIRRGRLPQESESYSSTLANPSGSSDDQHSRDGSPVPSDRATAGQLTADISTLSLSVNYLPSKFSSGILVGGGGSEAARRRPATQDSADFFGVPKMGGGIDVFKSGEARMGGEGDGFDDDDDNDDNGHGGGDGTAKRWFVRGRRQNSQPLKKKLRWNKFKWILFIANTIVSCVLLHVNSLDSNIVFIRWFFF